MPKNTLSMLKNKTFLAFFKRSMYFIGIFFAEILLLTLLLDFTGVNFGNAFISTHAHLITYLFVVLFFIMAHKDLMSVKKMKQRHYKYSIPLFIVNIVAFSGFYAFSKYITENPPIVIDNPFLATFACWMIGLEVPISLLFAFFDS